MKKLAAAIVWAGIALLCAQPVLATPPDVIDIREEPFAISETHIFLTRTTSDNLGLYESRRIESFLVAIDLETGAEEVWVLDLLHRTSVYSEDGAFQGYSNRRDDGFEAANPYALLIGRSAVPWLALSREGGANEQGRIVSDRAGITVSYDHGGVYYIGFDAWVQRLDTLGVSAAESTSNYRRMSTLETRQLYNERRIAPDSCEPDRVLDYWGLDRPAQNRFVRIVCDTGDDEGRTSLIVQLKPVSPKSEN